ncbi:MAG: nucleoside 2-deoxyribosyltransferase domain-containing protein [Rickettsiales bacterium]|jgi:hypothetical protein|nr:nucleoside 2-deoxyribosyltransferase domain-containing protein [Rickettsiales bacterium]
MKIFNSDGDFDKSNDNVSIFLAGPTLRGDDKNKYSDWRIWAIELFKNMKFDGSLYLPTPMRHEYTAQIDWEVYHLKKADCILFWIPRDLKILPGFTTNIEFGELLRSGKIVLGFPPNAEKMRYLAYRAKKYDVPVLETLKDTIAESIKIVMNNKKR